MKITVITFVRDILGNFFFFLFPDLNIRDFAGNTPLHVAILNDSYNVIDFLLQRFVHMSLSKRQDEMQHKNEKLKY